jgi:hypothetical protein
MKKFAEHRGGNAGDGCVSAPEADSSDDIDLLLRMAEQWEQLGKDRAELFRFYTELLRDGDPKKDPSNL